MFSAMATPPQSFQLDRSIFNQSLYDDLRSFWFEGLPEGSISAPMPLLQRWWGFNRTEEEKAAFDDECRARYGPALESIGPSRLSLPPFKSFDDDVGQASVISAPFLRDVKEAKQESGMKAADIMLSMVILLDQMPRQIYRDAAGLRLVYGHYDRLIFSLMRSCLTMNPSPIDHEAWKGKPVFKTWILMPFIHAEHAPTHQIHLAKIQKLRKECEESEDEDALSYCEKAEKAGVEHREPVEKFGRYPHRNECLGRKSTPEEDEYLRTANTFGVKQSQKQPEQRDEL